MPRPTIASVKERMKKAGIPGISIAYFDSTKPSNGAPVTIDPVFTGTTDKHASIPGILVNRDTVFGAASLSKPVFSYLVLKLIADKKLTTGDKPFGLDSPLSEIFPTDKTKLEECLAVFNTSRIEMTEAFLEQLKTLTPRMILSHTSGIPIDGSPRIVFPSGSQYSYGNTPLNFLNKLIEAKTGLSLETLAQEEVFRPLGMTHSTFLPPKICRLVKMSEDPTPKNQVEATSPRYILTDSGFFYYDNSTAKVEKIALSEDKFAELKEAFSTVTEATPIHNLTREQLKWIAQTTGHKNSLENPTAVPANSLHTTASDYARFASAWVQEKDCGLIKMADTPTVENQKAAATSRYILTDTGFFYYNKAKEHVEVIPIDATALKRLHATFPQIKSDNDRVELLSTPQLKAITGITGHTNPLQEAFRPVIKLTEDQWAVDKDAKEEDLDHLAWGLGLGLQLDNDGNVTTAFHYGDMSQWRTWVAIDTKSKSGVTYFANSNHSLNRLGHGYGHVLADVILAPEVNLRHGLEWFFKKLGFARNVEPGWKEREDSDPRGIDAYVRGCLASPPKTLKEKRTEEILESSRNFRQQFRQEIDATRQQPETNSSPAPFQTKLKPKFPGENQ